MALVGIEGGCGRVSNLTAIGKTESLVKCFVITSFVLSSSCAVSPVNGRTGRKKLTGRARWQR